jgi:hypothetical protein
VTLRNLIVRLLAKDPGKRPQDARAVIERLRRAITPRSPVQEATVRGLASRVAEQGQREEGLAAARAATTVPLPFGFRFTGFDVRDQLPEGWQEDIGAVAAEADFRYFPRTPMLSREAADITHITRGRVHVTQVQQRLPWLYRLYRHEFLELAGRAWGEPIEPALGDRYGVVLDVLRGSNMRFECHVDSNPVTGLLFFTSHPAGGGELVIGQDPSGVGVEELERDGTAVTPQAGQLIFFDGRTYPHYARPLVSESDVRVVAAMNFYTVSCPESTRPRELNRHRFGED